MSGFAKGGVAIIDGGSLAIAGNKPSGVAVQGNVIYHGGVAITWKLLTYTAASSGNTNTATTLAIDTTGANLLIISVASYAGPNVVTDSASNKWAEVVQAQSGNDLITEFYCFNPVTSTQHTFQATDTGGVISSIIVLAYQVTGLVGITFGETSAIGVNALTIPVPAITPQSDSLVLTMGAHGGNLVSVDNQFSIIVNATSGPWQRSHAIASLIPSSTSSLAPTWTDSFAYNGVGVMIDFIPSPWTLLTHTTLLGPGTVTTAIDTTGATLIVVVATFYASATLNLSDSAGNVWIMAGQQYNPALYYNRIYYCINPITSKQHTITVNSGTYVGLSVSSFHASAVISLDKVVGAAGTASGSSWQNPSLTPTVSNSLVIAGIGLSNYAQTIDSGFTMIDAIAGASGFNYGTSTAYLVQPTLSAVAPTWGFNTANDTYAANMLNFIPASVTTGLLDFWPMNEGAGTTFNNAVNPSNPMTASNITWATNTGFVNAPSPQFNGTTSGAVSAQNSTLNGPFSLCVAVIVTATNPNGTILFRSLTGSPAYRGFQCYQASSGALGASINTDYSTNQLIQMYTSSLNLNSAYYICLTYDGSGKAAGLLFYINGVLSSSTIQFDTLSGSFLTNLPVHIGANELGASILTGTLANARIYNRVLSASEVSQLAATMGK